LSRNNHRPAVWQSPDGLNNEDRDKLRSNEKCSDERDNMEFGLWRHSEEDPSPTPNNRSRTMDGNRGSFRRRKCSVLDISEGSAKIKIEDSSFVISAKVPST
jgi:hypothetical protein